MVIDRGGDKVILPREAYDQGRALPSPEKIREKIAKTVEAVEQDESVETIGFARGIDDPAPFIDIPRDRFPRVIELSAIRETSPKLSEKLPGGGLKNRKSGVL